jgi:hypothetical protein
MPELDPGSHRSESRRIADQKALTHVFDLSPANDPPECCRLNVKRYTG